MISIQMYAPLKFFLNNFLKIQESKSIPSYY